MNCLIQNLQSMIDMHFPILNELPPPPPGKTGWPWTEESQKLPENMPDGRPWPRISIVTPRRLHNSDLLNFDQNW